jgi:hypothetical protein
MPPADGGPESRTINPASAPQLRLLSDQRRKATQEYAEKRITIYASRGALADHGSFELSERADHLHHHVPGRSCGVDALGDRPEYALVVFSKGRFDEQALHPMDA